MWCKVLRKFWGTLIIAPYAVAFVQEAGAVPPKFSLAPYFVLHFLYPNIHEIIIHHNFAEYKPIVNFVQLMWICRSLYNSDILKIISESRLNQLEKVRIKRCFLHTFRLLSYLSRPKKWSPRFKCYKRHWKDVLSMPGFFRVYNVPWLFLKNSSVIYYTLNH